MPAGQKRAPDPITEGCEPPCGCWELNSRPLEEQSVLLTAEPSLQPLLQSLEEGTRSPGAGVTSSVELSDLSIRN